MKPFCKNSFIIITKEVFANTTEGKIYKVHDHDNVKNTVSYYDNEYKLRTVDQDVVEWFPTMTEARSYVHKNEINPDLINTPVNEFPNEGSCWIPDKNKRDSLVKHLQKRPGSRFTNRIDQGNGVGWNEQSFWYYNDCSTKQQYTYESIQNFKLKLFATRKDITVSAYTKDEIYYMEFGSEKTIFRCSKEMNPHIVSASFAVDIASKKVWINPILHFDSIRCATPEEKSRFERCEKLQKYVDEPEVVSEPNVTIKGVEMVVGDLYYVKTDAHYEMLFQYHNMIEETIETSALIIYSSEYFGVRSVKICCSESVIEIRPAVLEEKLWFEKCKKSGKYFDKPKFDSWCVKVTKENESILNAWRFGEKSTITVGAEIGSYHGIDKTNKKGGIGGFLDWSKKFDKVITTEEFYEKIDFKMDKNPIGEVAPKKELMYLPKKWYIVPTEENEAILIEWRGCGFHGPRESSILVSDGIWLKLDQRGDRIEITFEQFMKRVYKEVAVVNCTTQNEFDFFSKKMGYRWTNNVRIWNKNKEKTCLRLNEQNYSSIEYYKEQDIMNIYTFQEWCRKYGYFLSDERLTTNRDSVKLSYKLPLPKFLGVEVDNYGVEDDDYNDIDKIKIFIKEEKTEVKERETPIKLKFISNSIMKINFVD